MGQAVRVSLMVGIFMMATAIAASAQDFSRSVFRVFAEFDRSTSTGTSFVINADGVFVTNFHVVFDLENGAAAPETLQIGYRDERGRAQFATAEVLWSDQRNDLAVLGADLPVDLVALPILRSEQAEVDNVPIVPNVTEDVFAVGFPGVADTFTDNRGAPPELLIATVTDGIVSRVYRFSARGSTFGRAVVQHNAQINAGNSGGPLIDRCNRVIAVNTLKPVATFDLDQASAQDRRVFNQTPDGVFWATHSNTLLDMLSSSGTELTVIAGPCDPGLPFELPEQQNLWYWVAGGAGIVILGLLGGVFFLRSSATSTNRRVLSQLVREKLAERAGASGAAANSTQRVTPAQDTSGGDAMFGRKKKRGMQTPPKSQDLRSANPMVRLAAEVRARASGGKEKSANAAPDAAPQAAAGEDLGWSARMALGADGQAAAAAAPAPEQVPAPAPEPVDDRNKTRPAPKPGSISVPPVPPSGADVIQQVSLPPHQRQPAPKIEERDAGTPVRPEQAHDDGPAPMPMPKPGPDPEEERPVSRGDGFAATRPIAPPSGDETVIAGVAPAPAEPQRIMLKGEAEVTISSAWLNEQPDRSLTVGRSRDEADLTLDSLAISRVHARVTHKDGAFWVEDAGSSNGTKVNGTKISAPTRLATGDEVQFGDARFEIELL